ncbi:PLP-dependent aminotransferase family protein [Pseudomonas sp. S10E 269]|uniref:MocR-like pyridoxine biosynthesis transcription factor PdxR n=1 Tax=unclassified Pseudomonas TaxID=196821 RepID=UPI000C26A4A9|nr:MULTISPECIES: PLP-dependent aminotransferase family protein [unclassified Pseudomonas]PJK33836.1 PLP-dependent aminotransferase family protein [Pseudomonas sp. S09F 262]PJK37777.1 PLP-dependent aminotransferase family protein [Pseudomonas sp. S10E 269]
MVQMRKWRPLLKLDESGSQASYRKIAEGLVTAIVEGRLPPGTLLPGTREMAQLLDVNRKTVILAYEEALTKGWLVSEPRRGTFVNAQLTPKPLPSRAQQSFAPPILAQANAPYFTQNAQVTALQHRQGALFFDNGTSDHRLLPQAVLHRYYRNALRNSFASNTVRYGSEGTGYELRCALAEMLRNNRGLSVSAENICLTQGTQISLYLTASLLLKPGDVVLVERLSYPPAWEIFRKLGAQLVTVDVDDEGCRTDQIDRLCREHNVRMIYLTPHHQFPTTVSLHAARRQQLLALAAQHDFCIIEEDYDHEYHFNGRPYLPLASDRSQRHVIYVGSLSKALGSTFRCSYVVAPAPVVEALHSNAALMLGDADAVAQKMLADLINNGELKKHLRRVSKEYRARRETLQTCLHAAFGERISVREPEGGLALWVRFDDQINVDQMVATAVDHGLVVRSGRQFSPLDQPENALRLGFASLNQDEIREATLRLTNAANAHAHAQKNADHH